MKQTKINFIDYAFLLLRKFDYVNRILRSSFVRAADVFFIKNEAKTFFASHIAWVFGDGLVQCTNVIFLVNNPSPLTHENINKWRCSRGH